MQSSAAANRNERGYDAVRRLFLIEIAGVADELAIEQEDATTPRGRGG